MPQETDRRCDLTVLGDGVNAAEGVGSVDEGEESTSRQETEGDFICCNINNNNNDNYKASPPRRMQKTRIHIRALKDLCRSIACVFASPLMIDEHKVVLVSKIKNKIK